jgi:hypothetical protein
MKFAHLVFISFLSFSNVSFAECTCSKQCAMQCETGQAKDCQCKECDCAKGGHCSH